MGWLRKTKQCVIAFMETLAYAGDPMRAPPLRPSSIHVTSLCRSDTAKKSYHNVEKFPRAIGAYRGARCHAPLFWSCNKVIKPNFQSIVSQTNNDCSLLSFISAKLRLLDISCENIFALSVVTALTACPFSMKMCAK